MRYFVLGNINSGKTTFLDSLSKNLSDCKIYKIDDFRKKYGDGTVAGEETAINEFLKCVNQNNDMIVEFTGLGLIEAGIDKTIDYVVFLIDTPLDKCLSRLVFKSFNEIPYPKYSESIEDTIKRLDDEINNMHLIENKWSNKAIGFYRVSSELNNYPIRQLKLLSEILELLREYDETIVSYGGLARNELKENSDLDLFIINSRNRDEIYSRLININEYDIYTHSNKIVVMNNGIMVELLFVDRLEEIERLYYYSNVKVVERTLLNGSVDLNRLEEIKNTDKLPLIDDIKESAEKLVYTIISFDLELNKDDIYKLWFDSHIIVHEMLKLKSYLCGNRDYIYLPKNGHKYFTENEWKLIDMQIESDPKKYIAGVKPLARGILNEFKFLGLNIKF